MASHVASSLSVVEILAAVYASVDIGKIRTGHEGRDRIIISKGHAAAALYAVLNDFGLMDDDTMHTYYRNESLLGGHATHNVKHVEHSTGALGHGLPVGVGVAVGLRAKKINGRVFVIVGDGEMHEGSNWEALMLAGHLTLGNLCLLVDNNGFCGIGSTDSCCDLQPLAEKLSAFCLKRLRDRRTRRASHLRYYCFYSGIRKADGHRV